MKRPSKYHVLGEESKQDRPVRIGGVPIKHVAQSKLLGAVISDTLNSHQMLSTRTKHRNVLTVLKRAVLTPETFSMCTLYYYSHL